MDNDFNFSLFLTQSYCMTSWTILMMLLWCIFVIFLRILTIFPLYGKEQPRHFVPFVFALKRTKKKTYVFSATRGWVDDERIIFGCTTPLRLELSDSTTGNIMWLTAMPGNNRVKNENTSLWWMEWKFIWIFNMIHKFIYSAIRSRPGATGAASSGQTHSLPFMTFERHFAWDLQEWTRGRYG